MLQRHAAYEQHLQLTLAEAINILEDTFVTIVREERVYNEHNSQFLQRALERKDKELESLQADILETSHAIDDLNKTSDEERTRDKETIANLNKKIAIIEDLRSELDERNALVEVLRSNLKAEQEAKKSITAAFAAEREELSGKVEQVSKRLSESRIRCAAAEVERDDLLEHQRSAATQKAELERELLQARRDLEAATAATTGFLDLSAGSEDFGRPLATPRVRFSRRLSLSTEMNPDEIVNDSANGRENAGRSPDPGNRQTAGQSAFLKQLGELVSREDRKNIPVFKGDGDPFVADWLREAERIARSNEWDDTQKLKFFSSRLKGEASEWHYEFLERNPDHVDYSQWRDELRTRFTDEADVDRIRNKLNNLKQKEDQRVKAFIGRINQLYDTVHGKEPAARNDLDETARNYLVEIRKYRGEAKKKILLAGLLPKV